MPKKRNPSFPLTRLSSDEVARMQKTGRLMKAEAPQGSEVFMSWYLRPMGEGAVCHQIEVIGPKFFKCYKVVEEDKATADKIAKEIHNRLYVRGRPPRE